MKQIIFILLALISFTSYGQSIPSSTRVYVYKQYFGAPVRKTNGFDTLSAADSSYCYWYSNSNYNYQVKLSYTKVSGYVRIKAKLQGTSDTTGDYNNTCTWHTLRSDRTICYGCVDSVWSGGNATSVATGIITASPLNFYRVQFINDTSVAGTSIPKVQITSK